MTLIKSISGIRGTIGGAQGDNLTPIDVVKFTSAYARFISEKNDKKRFFPDPIFFSTSIPIFSAKKMKKIIFFSCF